MKYFTLSDFNSCARGISHLRETSLGVEFYRFSDALLTAYRKQEGWELRSLCPSGVALDFFTDSNRLFLQAQIAAGARETAYFDLYLNGIFSGTIGSTCPDKTISGEFCWQSTGITHVTLYLPHCRMVGIQQLALTDSTCLRPALSKPILLALGDSITQGMDAHHPSLCYPSVAARIMGMSLFNCGVGGYIFDVNSLPEAPVANPALITVAYGCNDWSAGRAASFAADYLARLRTLYPTIPIAVLEPIWRSGADDIRQEEMTGNSLANYRRELSAIIDKLPGMICLPMSKLLPAENSFLSDGTHPDTIGHIIYGNNLAQLLQQIKIDNPEQNR